MMMMSPNSVDITLPDLATGVSCIPVISNFLVTANISTGTIYAKWSSVVPGGSTSLDNVIISALPGGGSCVATNGISCSIIGLPSGVNYLISAVATNSGGYSSAPISEYVLIPGPQAPLLITNVITSGAFGFPIVITTSGGSGVSAINYLVSGFGCSTNGSSVISTVVGSCTVTATNPSNGVYTAVSSASQVFQFTPLAITTTTIKKPVQTTINCYKGKLLKKVTAVKPVCPAGYVKK